MPAAVPLRSIILDAVGGGRVERVMAESGRNVVAGDTLLVLSNNNLQLDVMNRGNADSRTDETIFATPASPLQQQRLGSAQGDLLTHETETAATPTGIIKRDSTLFSRGLVATASVWKAPCSSLNRFACGRDLILRSSWHWTQPPQKVNFGSIAESLVNMQRTWIWSPTFWITL